jgi:AmpD protein
MTPPLSVGPDGWCVGGAVVHYPSPNYDARPADAVVDLLVIHNISLPLGHFGTPHVEDLFTCRLDYNADPSFASLRGLEVSAHFFIRRDGRLIQFVSGDDRAWHAGASVFEGREQCNAFSLGVELEGSDFVPFTPEQYAALAELTIALQKRYPLAAVAGHEHIAPGRKTDPGPFFDWHSYKVLLQNQAVGQAPQGAMLVPTPVALRFPPGL